MMALGSHTVVVHRATTVKDAYGNEVRDWATASSSAVTGCSMQPVFGEEVTTGRDAVVSRWALFAPATIDLCATDRVEWRGETYEVDGEVQRWDFAPQSHVNVLLRRGADV